MGISRLSTLWVVFTRNDVRVLMLALATSSFLFLSSCSPQPLTEEQLITYASDPENGLVQTKEVNGLEITLRYRPTELIIAREWDQSEGNKEKLSELRKKYQNFDYFVMELTANGGEALYGRSSGYDHFSEMVSTLAFRMDQHAFLTTSERDTIPVGDFIFPRSYGLGGTTQVLFAFHNADYAETDQWIDFHLEEFGFGTGKQKFRFNLKDIRKIPRLKDLITYNPTPQHPNNPTTQQPKTPIHA